MCTAHVLHRLKIIMKNDDWENELNKNNKQKLHQTNIMPRCTTTDRTHFGAVKKLAKWWLCELADEYLHTHAYCCFTMLISCVLVLMHSRSFSFLSLQICIVSIVTDICLFFILVVEREASQILGHSAHKTNKCYLQKWKPYWSDIMENSKVCCFISVAQFFRLGLLWAFKFISCA